MIRSIASLATAMKQEQVQAEVETRVARMAMETAKAQGDAIVQMIEQQKEIFAHLGSNVNTWA